VLNDVRGLLVDTRTHFRKMLACCANYNRLNTFGEGENFCLSEETTPWPNEFNSSEISGLHTQSILIFFGTKKKPVRKRAKGRIRFGLSLGRETTML
jgi:hypothetical protein